MICYWAPVNDNNFHGFHGSVSIFPSKRAHFGAELSGKVNLKASILTDFPVHSLLEIWRIFIFY